MTDYQPPQIIASHPTDVLIARAAVSLIYVINVSDAGLKDDVTQIDRPLGGLRAPRG